MHPISVVCTKMTRSRSGIEANGRTGFEARAAEMAEAWARDGVSKWIAYDKATSDLIGRGGLSRRFVDGALRLELGWAILGSFWGHGYATEVGQAGLTFGFEQFDAQEIVAYTEPYNTRSRAVMERLNMRYLRDIVHEDETFVLYGMLRASLVSASGLSVNSSS
jgi:RimJ/RimL family protein N-acetyltransferase